MRNGLAVATGKTITAAALIMILVFGSFLLGGEQVIEGVRLWGWRQGILMDAVLIRMAIVPAVMFLFGDANWWFPKSLDRILPRPRRRPRRMRLPSERDTLPWSARGVGQAGSATSKPQSVSCGHGPVPAAPAHSRSSQHPEVVLDEHAALQDGQQAGPVPQDADVGEGVAVHHHQVGEVARPHRAQLVGPTQ